MNRIGIELDVEAGGFISGMASAERTVKSLTQAMKEAREEGRNEDFVRLQIQRDTLQTSTSGFKRDIQNELPSDPRLKTATMPSEKIQKPENIIGGFMSNAELTKEAVRSLEAQIKKAKETDDPKLGQLYYAREKLNSASMGLDRDTGNMLKNPKFQQIVDKQAAGKTFTKSEEKYIANLDLLNDSMKKNTAALLDTIKTGNSEELIKQMPQMEAQAKEFHKAANEGITGIGSAQGAIKTLIFGQIANGISEGVSRVVSSLDRSGIINQYGSGDIMGGRIAEERRQASLKGGITETATSTLGGALMLSGNPYAMAAGAALSLGGKLFSTLLQKGPNEEATDVAYAGLWQQRSADAMNLAALMGNPNMVRDAFRIAADAAAKFGYSAEEGIDAMNQAIRQGLDGDKAREVTEQVFDYERKTAASRETLSSVANMANRYGAGDALRAGWAGLHASGMTPGQYNEYLRGIYRVMENSISKGFAKSADEVVENFTMLAQMTGNSPLWQGENGARRLMDMNAGLESATGLRSTSDIVAFRAAQNIAQRQGKGSSYIDAMKVMEGGLTPSLFNEYMRLTKGIEGGNKEATVERMRQTFGLNYTNASALYEGWNPNMNEASLKALVDQYKNQPLPNASSPELEAQKTTQAITNWWTQTGQKYWDEKLPKTLNEELRKAIMEFNKKTGSDVPVPPSMLTRAERMEEELAPLGPIGKGMAIQANRIIENREANDLQRDIMLARTSSDLNAMFFGGKAARGSRAPVYDTSFFNKNESDDQSAYNRLISYRDSNDPQAQKAFLQAVEIMKSFSDTEKLRANETNSINRAIPDVMTDKTGQLLLEELRNMKINIHVH